MGSLKIPCTTSYRSLIDNISLNCWVFEKIAFFGILATDRQTNGQTDGHPRCVKPQSRYLELQLNKGVINLRNRFQILSWNRFRFHGTYKVDGLPTRCKPCNRATIWEMFLIVCVWWWYLSRLFARTAEVHMKTTQTKVILLSKAHCTGATTTPTGLVVSDQRCHPCLRQSKCPSVLVLWQSLLNETPGVQTDEVSGSKLLS